MATIRGGKKIMHASPTAPTVSRPGTYLSCRFAKKATPAGRLFMTMRSRSSGAPRFGYRVIIDMCKKALLLMMVIASLAFPAAAVQWRQVGPEGGTVTAIASATIERMVLAATARGLLFCVVDKAQPCEP